MGILIVIGFIARASIAGAADPVIPDEGITVRSVSEMIALYSQRVEDHVEQLAYHFTRGGNAQKALEYLERAGRRAEERSANLEAVSHFSAALELLRAMPHSPQRAEQELALLLALGPATNVIKGWDSQEVEGIYGRARELCQEAGETPQLLPALFGLAGYYIIRGEYNSAREFTDQNLNLALRTHDPDVLLEAHHYLAAMQTYAGELASARQSQDEVISRYDPKTHHLLVHLYAGDDPAACCLGHKAWTLWLLGYPEQALQTARAAMRLAQQLSHPFSLAQATWRNAWLHGVRGERARDRAGAGSDSSVRGAGVFALCAERPVHGERARPGPSHGRRSPEDSPEPRTGGAALPKMRLNDH